MITSVPAIILLSKRQEIEELKRLKIRAQLAGMIGHLIHALQSERGASSLYLASAGKRFRDKRETLIADTQMIEKLLRDGIEDELHDLTFANAKITALTAWALLGLDALPELRQRINRHQLSGHESVAAFSRLIAGLINLIFELADASVNPEISKLLVSLFNLIEGKEQAGQERAIGSLAFGSGRCDSETCQRILQLIEGQQNNFEIFLQFADDLMAQSWQRMEKSRSSEKLRNLREMIRHTAAESPLDPDLSDIWFDCCSDRISHMWSIQRQLIDAIQLHSERLIREAEQRLANSQGLLQDVDSASSRKDRSIDEFFDPDLPIEQSVSLHLSDRTTRYSSPHSVIDLLHAQSVHLADIERELESARRALNERKTIERAKGILMAQYHLSENDAHKKLRSASMEQNRRLIEVAETVLLRSGIDQ